MHNVFVIGFIAVLAGTSGLVHAESGGQLDPKAVARLQSMVRQLSNERDTLAADNARLNAEVEDVRKKFGDLRNKAQSALTQFKEQSESLGEKLRETESRVRELEEANARQAGEFNVCMQNNVKLYDSHRDILRQYDNKGVFAALLQREPLTGLKQVEIENLIEEYHDRIDQLRVKTPSPAAKAVSDEANGVTSN